jgi:hypothetical protein
MPQNLARRKMKIVNVTKSYDVDDGYGARSFTPYRKILSIHPTLPLSGRPIHCAGEAESLRWPVHSRGLFGGDQKKNHLQIKHVIYVSFQAAFLRI